MWWNSRRGSWPCSSTTAAAGCCAAHRRPRRPRAHRQEHLGDCRRQEPTARLEVRRRQRPRGRRRRFLRRHPAARRTCARRGLSVGERGGIVIDDGCRTSDPDIYAIGECAAVERQDVSAWSRPAIRWPQTAASRLCRFGDRLPFRGRRYEHQAQADGGRCGLARRCARRPCPARAAIPSSTNAGSSTRSWWSARTARSCSAEFWSATPTTTAAGCR